MRNADFDARVPFFPARWQPSVGHVKQRVSKHGVMTFAWRPGSQYDVSATRGADIVLASDCRAQFGRPSARRGCRICVTVRLLVRRRRDNVRVRKLNTNFFFSNFSGTPGISRENPGMSQQKVWFPWVSEDIPNFLAPTPSLGRPPPHPKISGPKSLGLGSFSCLKCTGKQMRIPPFPLPPPLYLMNVP